MQMNDNPFLHVKVRASAATYHEERDHYLLTNVENCIVLKAQLNLVIGCIQEYVPLSVPCLF